MFLGCSRDSKLKMKSCRKKMKFDFKSFLWDFWCIFSSRQNRKIFKVNKNLKSKLQKWFFGKSKKIQKFFKRCQEWSFGLGDKILGHSWGGEDPFPPLRLTNCQIRSSLLGTHTVYGYEKNFYYLWVKYEVWKNSEGYPPFKSGVPKSLRIPSPFKNGKIFWMGGILSDTEW